MENWWFGELGENSLWKYSLGTLMLPTSKKCFESVLFKLPSKASVLQAELLLHVCSMHCLYNGFQQLLHYHSDTKAS